MCDVNQTTGQTCNYIFRPTVGRVINRAGVDVRQTACSEWPQKVSHYQLIKKSYQIVLKPVNETIFIRPN